jgi:hypothetical protein
MKFKQGGVYVDDETGAVYECQHTPITNQEGASRTGYLKLLSAHNSDTVPVGFCFTSEDCVSLGLRHWQVSDEPEFYDVERWGNIEIGKVYRSFLTTKIVNRFIYVGQSLDDHFFFAYYEGGKVTNMGVRNKKDIHLDITRPAFPDEIAGLKLPQLQGEIK